MNLLNTLAGIAGQTLKGPSMDAMNTHGPTLYAGIRELARQMGYARAWRHVADLHPATGPVYEWLVCTDMLMTILGDEPTAWDFREHGADLVEQGDLAVAVFGPALVDGHEARPALDQIVRALKAIRGAK